MAIPTEVSFRVPGFWGSAQQATCGKYASSMTVNGKPVNSGAFRIGGSADRIKPGTWRWQPGNTTETQRKHWKGIDEDPIDIYRSYMILFILSPHPVPSI